MLDKLLNKKVRVAVAFNKNAYYSLDTEYYVGVLAEYDDNFIRFESDTLIAIKYIQVIEIYDENIFNKKNEKESHFKKLLHK